MDIQEDMLDPSILIRLRKEYYQQDKPMDQQFTDPQLLEFHKFTQLGATACLFENGKVFPVFPFDTIESTLKRYYELFPAESAAFFEDVSSRINDLKSENGMSTEGTVRFAGSIPAIVYHSMINLDPDFWRGKNIKKNIGRLAAVAPRFFHGRS